MFNVNVRKGEYKLNLMESIQKTKLELLNKYKEVHYENDELVLITKDTIKSNYIRKRVYLEKTNVEYIENRFNIEGEIEAIKVNFKVKYPRRRKYSRHEEYYKIVEREK